MNTKYYGAILDENNYIKNVLVFANIDDMNKFDTLPLASDQSIGDLYKGLSEEIVVSTFDII